MLTDSALETLANAVFAKPDPWVAEHYSEFDEEALRFVTAESLAGYLRAKLSSPTAYAAIVVTYPDMGACALRRLIHLKPESVPGHTHRTVWEGWGVIVIELHRGQVPSRVTVNSRKRAAAWALTYPNLGSPDAWNWKAVESHSRRLQRVLRRLM
jgi:hypothetical protein